VIVGTAAALALTLTPVSAPATGLVPGPRVNLRDFIFNLGLLVPVGVGLRLRGWRLGPITAGVLALSGGIELLQLLLPLGRDASLLDVVANSSGAVIAAWAVPQIPRALAVSSIGARWFVAAGLLAWAVQAALTAWALQRDIPATAEYWGQWAHVFSATKPLTGVVTDFMVQGAVIADGPVPNTDALRAALVADTVTLYVAARDLGPSAGRAQIAAIAHGEGTHVAGFERYGCVIKFRVRVRGERVGLRAAGVVVPTSCRLQPGITVITGRAARDARTITVRWDQETRQATLQLAPSLGWRLLVPLSWSWRGGAWDVLGSVLWLALWGAPVAMWLQIAWPRNLPVAALFYVIGLLGGTAVVAVVSGLSVGTRGDIIGVALGWLIGGWLNARRVASWYLS